jgi:DNA-binding GntR family transcriptional regulator
LKYLLRRNFEHIILRTKLDSYNPGRMDAVAEDHRRLLENIKKKELQACVDRIQTHIRRSRDYIIRCLSKDEQAGIESIPFFENVEG